MEINTILKNLVAWRKGYSVLIQVLTTLRWVWLMLMLTREQWTSPGGHEGIWQG